MIKLRDCCFGVRYTCRALLSSSVLEFHHPDLHLSGQAPPYFQAPRHSGTQASRYPGARASRVRVPSPPGIHALWPPGIQVPMLHADMSCFQALPSLGPGLQASKAAGWHDSWARLGGRPTSKPGHRTPKGARPSRLQACRLEPAGSEIDAHIHLVIKNI